MQFSDAKNNILRMAQKCTNASDYAGALANYFNSQANHLQSAISTGIDGQSAGVVQVLDDNGRKAYVKVRDVVSAIDADSVTLSVTEMTANDTAVATASVDDVVNQIADNIQESKCCAEVLTALSVSDSLSKALDSIRAVVSRYASTGADAAARAYATMQDAILSGGTTVEEIIKSVISMFTLPDQVSDAADFIESPNFEGIVSSNSQLSTCGAAAWVDSIDVDWSGVLTGVQKVGKAILGCFVGLGVAIGRAAYKVKDAISTAFISGNVFQVNDTSKLSNKLLTYDAMPGSFRLHFRVDWKTGLGSYWDSFRLMDVTTLSTTWGTSRVTTGITEWDSSEDSVNLLARLYKLTLTGNQTVEESIKQLYAKLKAKKDAGVTDYFCSTRILTTKIPGAQLSFVFTFKSGAVEQDSLFGTSKELNGALDIIIKPVACSTPINIVTAYGLSWEQWADDDAYQSGITQLEGLTVTTSGGSQTLTVDQALQRHFSCGAQLAKAFISKVLNVEPLDGTRNCFGTVYIGGKNTDGMGVLSGVAVVETNENASSYFTKCRAPFLDASYGMGSVAKYTTSNDVLGLTALCPQLQYVMGSYRQPDNYPQDFAAPFRYVQAIVYLLEGSGFTASSDAWFWPYHLTSSLPEDLVHFNSREDYANAFARGLKVAAAVLGVVVATVVCLKIRKACRLKSLQYKIQADQLVYNGDGSLEHAKQEYALLRKANRWSVLGGAFSDAATAVAKDATSSFGMINSLTSSGGASIQSAIESNVDGHFATADATLAQIRRLLGLSGNVRSR